VGSIASLPFHFGFARSLHDVGTSLPCTRFVFHATTNFSRRSAVQVSKRYAFATCDRYGDFVYGTSTFAKCWKNSMFVPFVSTMSAPLSGAAFRSAMTRAVTSSLEPRKRLSLIFG